MEQVQVSLLAAASADQEGPPREEPERDLPLTEGEAPVDGGSAPGQSKSPDEDQDDAEKVRRVMAEVARRKKLRESGKLETARPEGPSGSASAAPEVGSWTAQDRAEAFEGRLEERRRNVFEVKGGASSEGTKVPPSASGDSGIWQEGGGWNSWEEETWAEGWQEESWEEPAEEEQEEEEQWDEGQDWDEEGWKEQGWDEPTKDAHRPETRSAPPP